jgi:1,4-dihydroxy-2-naphthoyl-CoA synthase
MRFLTGGKKSQKIKGANLSYADGDALIKFNVLELKR